MQIVDDDGVPVPTEKEGNIGVRCSPHRPVGLFSCYVVQLFLSSNFPILIISFFEKILWIFISMLVSVSVELF